MLLSVLIMTTSAALAAAAQLDPKEVCKTAGACLRIREFYAIEPVDKKSADRAAIEFNIFNDNPQFGASAECEADWPAYGTQGWPQQSKECSTSAFSFYINGFSDIDQDFVIEAKHGYRDPSVAGPPSPGRAPMDFVTNFARATVTKEVVECETFGVSYKFCHLKKDVEILLPIYSKTA